MFMDENLLTLPDVTCQMTYAKAVASGQAKISAAKMVAEMSQTCGDHLMARSHSLCRCGSVLQPTHRQSFV